MGFNAKETKLDDMNHTLHSCAQPRFMTRLAQTHDLSTSCNTYLDMKRDHVVHRLQKCMPQVGCHRNCLHLRLRGSFGLSLSLWCLWAQTLYTNRSCLVVRHRLHHLLRRGNKFVSFSSSGQEALTRSAGIEITMNMCAGFPNMSCLIIITGVNSSWRSPRQNLTSYNWPQDLTLISPTSAHASPCHR